MEFVAPIKDLHLIRLMKKYLKEKSSRDYLLFVIGINTGLRIGELLQLKVSDVSQPDGTILQFLETDDEHIYLNEQVKQALLHHFQTVGFTYHEFLFKSTHSDKPISRQQAYRIVNEAAKSVGITEKIGTHTLRKTFGYHAYVKGVAISLIQKRFHHATPSETLKYIGIEKDEPQTIDVNL